MASKETIKALRSQIEDNRVKSVSGQWFIPQSKVREIFSYDKIDLSVAELTTSVHDRLRLAESIQQGGTITFAILVWMREEDSIVSFRNHECLDNQLPLNETRAQEISPEFGLTFAREYQWQFQPYYFTEGMYNHHRVITDGIIFPFVGEEHIAEGGFGKISELSIPDSMQEFPGTTVTTVRLHLS